MKPRVLLGMSGGVDSSVSAVLLLEAGYEVVGAFMKNWSSGASEMDDLSASGSVPPSTDICRPSLFGTRQAPKSHSISKTPSNCNWREDRRDAMRVAAKLGIPFHTLDFEAEYREKVVKNLFQEYAAGRTPNPDVLCNKFVKFDLFMRAADELGCDFVATGHYAGKKMEDGKWEMEVPKDLNKDQTYFLWAMPKEALARTLFPLANLTKPEVRELARMHQLPVAEKKDSVGICFVGEVDIVEFLKQEIPPNPGPILTTDGRQVGEHEGLAFFTIGQRHGIGTVGGGTPYYVVRKDTERNALIVGSEVDPELFSNHLTAKDVNWLVDITTPSPLLEKVGNIEWVKSHLPSFLRRGRGWLSYRNKNNCLVRIRYRQELQKASVEVLEGGKIQVTFQEPQRAITPGQSIVLYTEDGVVLGGGVIE